MKFIKPSEISSKIMTLIEESDQFVIIVSPYVKISKWFKLLKKIDHLKTRKIPINFIIRDDKTNQNSFDELDDNDLPYKAIPDLHCKLYLNEKYAIVSSMNLLLSSEINSLEIAYQTETETEYNELKEFCKRYLNVETSAKIINSRSLNFVEFLTEEFKKEMTQSVDINQNEHAIKITTKSRAYEAFICQEGRKYLRLNAALTSKENEFFKSNPQELPVVNGVKVELIGGNNRYEDKIWGSSDVSLKSHDLLTLQADEKSIVSKLILEFVSQVEIPRTLNQHISIDIFKDLKDSEISLNSLWTKCVQSIINGKPLKSSNGKLIVENFPSDNFVLESQNGVSTIILNHDMLKCKQLFDKYNPKITPLFNDYRLFWNYPYNKLQLYGAKNKSFGNEKDEIRYYHNGLTVLTEFVKSMNFK